MSRAYLQIKVSNAQEATTTRLHVLTNLLGHANDLTWRLPRRISQVPRRSLADAQRRYDELVDGSIRMPWSWRRRA